MLTNGTFGQILLLPWDPERWQAGNYNQTQQTNISLDYKSTKEREEEIFYQEIYSSPGIILN